MQRLIGGGRIIEDQGFIWLKRWISMEIAYISNVTIFESNMALDIGKVTITTVVVATKSQSVTLIFI